MKVAGLHASLLRHYSKFNVRKINYILQDVDSCLKLSVFPEHPKNPTNKPHLLRCGKLKGFFDLSYEIQKQLFKNKILDSAQKQEVFLTCEKLQWAD